ncbi:MAG TPA: DUF4845 domain-containing protein [Gammaproteobacteria bacterium]|nr:DUF4845 domain-containing protein [Gammaproteobacteria bacterium]
MKSLQRQQGMTTIGWILTFLLIAFFTLIALKIVPIYIDSFKAVSILDDMEKDAYEVGAMSPGEIVRTLHKRLSINMVEGVTDDDIYVERNGDSMTIGLDYEVRRNLFGNLDVVVSFEKSIEVPVR